MTAPDDPIGTVRAGDGLLAIRAHTESSDDELSWFIIDIGFGGDLRVAQLEGAIGTWPIVYQP